MKAPATRFLLGCALALAALPVSADAQAPGATTPAPQTSAAPAAEAPASTGLKLELLGSVGLATSGTVHSVSFGGPRLTLGVGDFRFAFSMYPSVVYNPGWTNGPVRPLLGAGPEIGWKRIAIFAPVYFTGTDYAYLVGLGYRF
ncbi:MAG TPA: hypothetical protein VK447_02760 [Myxococcaceae bacterium]|nr:hypothetical protein [Myxococcaceae bacterium]